MPEVATRHHVESLQPVSRGIGRSRIEEDVTAKLRLPTTRLGRSQLFVSCQGLVWAHGLPLIPANHMAGAPHGSSEWSLWSFPASPLVSRGTELVCVSEAGLSQRLLGDTRCSWGGFGITRSECVMGLTYPAVM